MHDNKLKAAFLDLASIHADDLDLAQLETCFSDWEWFDKIHQDELMARIKDFDVIVSNKVILGESVLKQAERLKLICVSATGTNNVDLDAAREKGIVVCNVQAYATASVVQHVFSLILTLLTRLDELRHAVTDKRWSHSDNFCVLGIPATELRGKKIGIVGYGELGQGVAKIAQAFGMKVLIAKRDAADEREGRIGLSELLKKADVLSLHCPLNSQTQNMISSKELAMMKPSAIVVNTARGGLIDEQALLKALKEKVIAGAALDVLVEEPPAIDNTLINAELVNLIITPHVAWASRESRQRLVDEITSNINAFISGKARNVV